MVNDLSNGFATIIKRTPVLNEDTCEYEQQCEDILVKAKACLYRGRGSYSPTEKTIRDDNSSRRVTICHPHITEATLPCIGRHIELFDKFMNSIGIYGIDLVDAKCGICTPGLSHVQIDVKRTNDC